MRIHPVLAGLAAVIATAVSVTAQSSDGFRFRSGVELVNVTATVTDDGGRFVSGLRKEDFTVYDDGVRQEVSHFSSDRVPVSLGIVLDASGSMTSDKIATAQAAIDRFIHELLGKDDELFFMEFANQPRLTQQWTKDRRLISRADGRPLHEVVSARIWRPLGAEADACIHVDPSGTGHAGAGFNCRLRDLARFGEMVRLGGRLNG